jgi:hypothetical protein
LKTWLVPVARAVADDDLGDIPTKINNLPLPCKVYDGTVTGVIFNESSGRAVAGVAVKVDTNGVIRNTTTSAQGKFSFTGLPKFNNTAGVTLISGNIIKVSWSKSGFAAGSEYGEFNGGWSSEYTYSNEFNNLKIKPTRVYDGVITGRVTMKSALVAFNGKGLGGVTVTLTGGVNNNYSTVTAADGSFRFGGLALNYDKANLITLTSYRFGFRTSYIGVGITPGADPASHAAGIGIVLTSPVF